MDAIPTETHAAEITATVEEIERGLTVFPLSKAVNRIDDWRRKVLDTENAALVPIADALGELHDALTGEIDGAAVGPVLVRLGAQTADAADTADAALQNGLRRLGSLLTHAGSALS